MCLRRLAGDDAIRSEEEHLVSLGDSPAGLDLHHAETLAIKGQADEKWPFEMPPQFAHRSLKSGCWIPLIGGEGVLGTLNVFSRRAGNFTDDDVNILTQIAGQVAIAFGNALAFQRLSELKDQLAEQKQYLEDELKTEFNFEEIVGHSKPIRRVLKQVETVAPTDSTVLILGETGTGKELLARAVHNLSPRHGHTFVRVNCASIPAGLLESELFGHEKGAFTGAIAARVGRLELAHQGTIFLDEVGDIPLELQPKLLRALQEKEFERLGSTRTITTDVRIVAATNRDLAKAGSFRAISQRPVLPSECFPDHGAAAARAARRYPTAGSVFPVEVLPADEEKHRDRAAGWDAGVDAVIHGRVTFENWNTSSSARLFSVMVPILKIPAFEPVRGRGWSSIHFFGSGGCRAGAHHSRAARGQR